MDKQDSQSALPPAFDPDIHLFYHRRPRWLQGYVSLGDAIFLREAIERELPSVVLEIGSASGFSAAVICHSLEAIARTAGATPEYRIISYDNQEHFYADTSKRVGDAAREQLDAEMLAHVEFRNPRMAADAAHDFPSSTIPFIFIDANHAHPWPALDLLAVSDIVRPGGVVLLHDINLPIVAPHHPELGPRHVFNGLKLEKSIPKDSNEVPNIGQLRLPDDKAALRRDLISIINSYPWETDVPDHDLERLGLRRYTPSNRLPIIRGLWARFGPRRLENRVVDVGVHPRPPGKLALVRPSGTGESPQ